MENKETSATKRKKVKNKTTRLMIVVGLNIFTLFCSVLYITVSWFTSNTVVSGGASDIVAVGPDLTIKSASLFRSDGVYYNYDGEDSTKTGSYDGDGNALTNYDFSMIQYDSIITSKNDASNLVMKISFALNKDFNVSTNRMIIKATTTNTTANKYNDSDGYYPLSTVSKIAAISGDTTLDAFSTSSTIYAGITGEFTTIAPTYYCFNVNSTINEIVYVGGENGISLSDTYGSTTIASGTQVAIYLNLEYDETLVSTFLSENSGIAINPTSTGNAVAFISDFSFDLSIG